MITDILDYISSYDNIRAVTGLNSQELKDDTLALIVYRNRLSSALSGISGVYTPETEEQNLQEIFERPVPTTDSMYAAIQQYSIYVVADAIMDTVGLRAYKAIADGKSSITRFSPESAYQDSRKAIKEQLGLAIAAINNLLEITTETLDTLVVVTPDVDLVTGE